MTQIADARRARVHPGDLALVLVTAIAVVSVPTTDVVVEGARWVTRNLDTYSTYVLVLVLLVVGGVVSMRRIGQRGNGRLMLLAALASSMRSIALTFADIGPLAFVGDALQWTYSILAAQLLLRWPRSRLQTRTQRWTIIGAWVLPTGSTLLGDVFYSPAAHKWTTPAWWPLLVRNDEA